MWRPANNRSRSFRRFPPLDHSVEFPTRDASNKSSKYPLLIPWGRSVAEPVSAERWCSVRRSGCDVIGLRTNAAAGDCDVIGAENKRCGSGVIVEKSQSDASATYTRWRLSARIKPGNYTTVGAQLMAGLLTWRTYKRLLYCNDERLIFLAVYLELLLYSSMQTISQRYYIYIFILYFYIHSCTCAIV